MRKLLLKGFLAGSMALTCAVAVFAGEAKITVEQIVAGNQASIGKPEVLAGSRVRVLQGKLAYGEIYSQMKKMTGLAMLVSGGRLQKTQFKFGSVRYPGETILVDEKGSTQIAEINPGTRSLLGEYLFTEPAILKEGLFGGSMSTTWPLLDSKAAPACMRYKGLKKIRGQQLLDVEYTPRSGRGDMVIHLYFEPESFRHVLTLYTIARHSQTMGDVRDNGADEMRTFLEERFSEFKTVNGLTFPSRWNIHWKAEPIPQPQEYEWDVVFSDFQNNPPALMGTQPAK